MAVFLVVMAFFVSDLFFEAVKEVGANVPNCWKRTQRRMEILRMSKTDADKILFTMRCLLAYGVRICIRCVIWNRHDHWLCPCCSLWDVVEAAAPLANGAEEPKQQTPMLLPRVLARRTTSLPTLRMIRPLMPSPRWQRWTMLVLSSTKLSR